MHEAAIPREETGARLEQSARRRGGPEGISRIPPGRDFELGLTVDPVGTAHFTGSFAGPVTIGATPFTTLAQQYSLILASVSAAGDPDRATRIDDGALKDGLYLPFAASLAIHGSEPDKLILEGAYHGALALDPGFTNTGYSDVFLGRVSSTGPGVDWAHTYGDQNSQLGTSVAVDGNGTIAVAGFFNFALSLRGSCASITTGSQDFDAFVAKFDALGDCQWVRQIRAPASRQFGTGVAFDRAGRVALVGTHQSSVDLGGGLMLADPGESKYNGFVALFDGADGVAVYASSLGESGENSSVSVAADALGNVVMGASLQDAKLSYQADVRKIDPPGKTIRERTFGGAGDEGAASIDVDDLGRVLLTGYFSGKATFDGFDLTSEGGTDAFVAVLDGSGAALSVRQPGGKGNKSGSVIRHIPGGGGAVVLGGFSGELRLGCDSYQSLGGRDLFLARFNL